MAPVVDLAVDALAAHRLTRLAQRDTLPPVVAARERLAARLDGSPWAEVLDCAWCGSVHAAAIVTLARTVAPRAWRPLARILALSTVAGFLSELEYGE